MNRRDTVLALVALGTTPLASFAQRQGKLWRVGFLLVDAPPAAIPQSILVRADKVIE